MTATWSRSTNSGCLREVPVTRPLEDAVVGISISEGEDLGRYGLTSADVNRVTVELCRRLIGLGAQVVLGHKWMPGGVMQAVARFAQAYQSGANRPIIHNYLGWPDRAALSGAERATLQTIVNIVEASDRPEWHEADGRTRALTRMREEMTDINHARVILSGRWVPQPGRSVAGAVEEAALTATDGKGIYLSRMMGGAAANLVAVLKGERPPATAADRMPVHGERIEQLRQCGLERLSEQSGLSVKDMNALFEAQNIDTVMHLASRGLRNLLQQGRLSGSKRR